MHRYLTLLKKTSFQRLLFHTGFLFPTLLISVLSISNVQFVSAATWQADFTVRVSSPRTQTIFFKGRFYQAGAKVRIEPEDSDEIDLFDFEAKIGMRVFPEDRIFFTTPLSPAKIIKAVKEAWIPTPLPYQESKILLWQGEIRGKAGRLYFVTLALGREKLYVMRWLTDDIYELPLRIIYPGPANETVIVDYEPLISGKFSQDHFEPPTEYLSLNPF